MTQPAKSLLPLMNRVLIKKAEVNQQTKSGVVIPHGTKNGNPKGVVVAVGPGTTMHSGRKVPCCLKEGDLVLLPDYGGTKVECGDKNECFLYRENDILAKISS